MYFSLSAMDTHPSLSPVLQFFELLGLYSGRKRYLFGLACNLVLLISLLFYYQRNHAVVNEHAFMEYFNDGIQLLVTQLSVFVVFIETVHRRRDYRRYWRVVEELDSSLNKLNVKLQPHHSKFIRVYSLHVVLLLTATIAIECLVVMNSCIDQQWVIYWQACIHPLLLSRIRLLQVGYFLRIPSVHLQVLEEYLQRVSLPMDRLFRVTSIRTLVRLKGVHRLILQEMRILNRIFNYSLGFLMFQVFVEVLSGAYWLYYYQLSDHCVFGGSD